MSVADLAELDRDRCRTCGAPIIWVYTRAGKYMPLDAAQRPGGNVRDAGLTIGGRPVVDVVRAASPDELGWVAHFTTCPNAERHRRRRSRRS